MRLMTDCVFFVYVVDSWRVVEVRVGSQHEIEGCVDRRQGRVRGGGDAVGLSIGRRLRTSEWLDRRPCVFRLCFLCAVVLPNNH